MHRAWFDKGAREHEQSITLIECKQLQYMKLPILFWLRVGPRFFNLLPSLAYRPSRAMALPECFRELGEAVGLQQATSAAKTLLSETDDIRTKQKKVQQLLTDSGVDVKLFQCLFESLEDQMEDTELEAYLELWGVEVKMAAEDAEKEIVKISQTDGFQTTDIEMVSGYVASSVAVAKQKRKIGEAPSDIEEEASTAQSTELSSLEEALKTKVQNVQQAKRARLREARKNMLLSPRKSAMSSEQASPSRSINDCKQEGNGDDTQASTLAAHSSEPALATDSSQENTLAMAVPTSPAANVSNPVSSPVSVSQLIDNMNQDAEVYVKVFYIPYGISTVPAPYSPLPLKIYETRVGAEGREYTLVAKGDAAAHAASELAEFGEQVVKLRHVKHSQYKGEDQLEVTENMEVEECVDEDKLSNLTQQLLQKYSLQRVLEHKSRGDKTRLSLQTCSVMVDSKSKPDKNGNPFRATQVHDAAGAVTKVMVWGGLAANDDLWKLDAVVDIYAAEVHFSEKRLNIRPFSQVKLASQPASFKKPTKLTYLKWD